MAHSNHKKQRGTTLLDVVVGVGILGLTFVAILGLFRMTTSIITLSKSKAGAVALATDQVELLRSLSYSDVGTQGGIPGGNIPQNEVITLNGIDYSRRTFIQYVDAPQDGLGVLDDNSITTDYKVVKVEIQWQSKNGTTTISTVSNIVPPGIETLEGGGTLTIEVFDALGAPIENVDVNIFNDDVVPNIDLTTFTNSAGRVSFPGTPEDTNYDITVTKTGYSTAQTYEANATNTNPSPPPATVIEGSTTNLSFQIDLLSQKTVRTFEPVTDALWEDDFNDSSKVGLNEGMEVTGGVIQIARTGPDFNATGSAYTVDIVPSFLDAWDTLTVEIATSVNTELVYRVYRIDGGRNLVPEVDLPGNAIGFTSPTLDLSALPANLYPQIQIGVFASTSDPAVSPNITRWEITHTVGPTPIADIPFAMRGDKTIGQDAGSNPIYKYDENLQTDSSGVYAVSDLEFDNYTITIDDGATGYDISESCEPQPLAVAPNISTTTDFYLVADTAHTLLVAVYDDNGNLLPGADVRLFRVSVPSSDQTLSTSACGQVFFSNMAEGTAGGGNSYSADVSASGFTTQNLTNVDVSGVSTLEVTLVP